MMERYQRITNPDLARFLDMNPTPSLSYLPDTNRAFYISLYLKDRRESLLDLVAADPLQATFHVFPEGPNHILRVELHPSQWDLYWAETEFHQTIPEQVDAFKRLLFQTSLELTMVDNDLYYLTTKLYSNDPLRRFRHLAADFR